ncbi:hypothetical protein [Methanospirillum hungatei]|uniref:hypothetical protein n=1 Tax=Methanospirillum hungatei TaxID=2203 RepID=UPI0026EE3D84|nr:hypothetical protein [Methanospirillum hungatei]
MNSLADPIPAPEMIPDPEIQFPHGDIPPGSAPLSGNSDLSYTLSGKYTIDGDIANESNETYLSDMDDVSAVYVTNGGTLTLKNPVISTSGNTSSNDASSFFGLNGAVLANNGSTVVIEGGTISTTGSGANGAIPTGEGTSISLKDVTITASGNGGHGVMATLGAVLNLENVSITTTGPHGAPIATDRGSGTVTVKGGSVYSSGDGSPGIYSTGKITVNDLNILSEGTEAAVIEGSNSIFLTNSTVTGGDKNTPGVMIYQSFSGDAEVGKGIFTMEGGTLNNRDGSLFFVTNTDALITLNGVKINAGSGVLVNASATSRWGKTGENGGKVTFTAYNEILNGSFYTDEISSIAIKLLNNTELTGEIHTADLELDATSTWSLTGDSTITGLTDPDGISGNIITNIIGNGYTVTYNPDNEECSALEGKTYSLVNGGILLPKN